MITMTKGCPFCGQGHVIQIGDDWNEEQVNDAVVKVCACEGAEKHKEMNSVRKRVKEFFGDESLKKFDDAFGIEVQDDLVSWAEKVYDGLYEKLTVVLENGDKAIIQRSGARIKISREQKVKAEK